jgi:formylglycine-generating enzyme required for sulfatase activity
MRSFIDKSKKNFIAFTVVALFGLATVGYSYAASETPKDMILVNPGGFMRGLDKSAQAKKQNSGASTAYKPFDDEGPASMIYLSAYYIDKYEVSNAQYTEFIKATDHPAPAYWDHHELNQPNHPVTGVNWYDANAYCHWANKRLPTEAEWEKAARGPAGTIFPWGNEMDYQKGNFAKGKTGIKNITVPVNAFPEGKSYYGAYNMAGNVFEWVQDWYASDYYKTSKEIRNPQGPSYPTAYWVGGNNKINPPAGKKKVIRGGSWFAPAQSVTTTHRFWNNPMNNSYGVGLGFRCAMDFEIDEQKQARSFYMKALINMGAEKYQKAHESIGMAIKSAPNNNEYQALKRLIEKELAR